MGHGHQPTEDLTGFLGDRKQVQISCWCKSQVKAGETNVPAGRQRERILSYSTFYSIRVFNGLGGVVPHGRGQPASLSLQIQLLTSFGNTLKSRNNVLPNIWALRVPSTWHITLTITLFKTLQENPKSAGDTKTRTPGEVLTSASTAVANSKPQPDS